MSTSNNTFLNSRLACARNEYALDSWLRVFITLVGSDRGILLIHGAGTRLGNNAFLFAGISGRGKSTITRILGVRNALSDEITLLEERNKAVYAYSTPFWGELARPATKPQPAKPLKCLLFLQHGTSLVPHPLDQGAALTRLMATILFFSREPKTARGMMQSAVHIATRVPAASLYFSLHNTRQQLCRLLKGYPL